MFCNRCGNQLLEGAMFCNKCGTKIQNANHQTNQPVYTDNNYHPQTFNPNYNNMQQPIIQQQNYNQYYTANQNLPQYQKPKKKRKWLKGLGITAAVIVSLFVILIAFGASGEDPGIINKKTNVSGGAVSIGDAVIELPQDAGTYSIDVYEKKPLKESTKDSLEFYSNIYEINGNLDDFNHKVEVKIKLTDKQVELIKGNEKLMRSTYIVLLEEVHSPSSGVSYLEKRLDSKIDLATKTVSAFVDLTQKDTDNPQAVGNKDSGSQSIFHSALLSMENLLFTKAHAYSGEAANTGNEKSSLAFQVKSYRLFWEQVVSKDEWFKIVYSPDEIQNECVPLLLEDLQWSKKFLEGMGFSFKTIYKPIYVEIKDLDGMIGAYKGSKFLRSDDAIYIDKSSFLINAEGYKKLKRQEVKVTAAHELFHLVQSYYNPQTRLKQNHPWASKPFLWLEEAAATWIEPKVAGGNYVPDNAADNISFINNSLSFTHTRENGYGASIFLKYIEGRTNAQSVYQTFLYSRANAELLSSVPDGAAITAFNKVMREIYQKSPEELWTDFVKTYYTDPKSIYTWLDTSPLKEKSVFLKAKTIPVDDKKSDVEFLFNTKVSTPTHITGTSKGNYLSKVNAKADINCTLENLSADFLKISFSGDHSAFNWKGAKLKLTVNTTGKTGVMVYDSKMKSIAGSPWSFLSSSAWDNRFKGSSTITIDNFTSNGTGYIMLMPFNFDTSDVKSSGKIDITVEYIPGQKPDDPPDPDDIKGDLGMDYSSIQGVYNGMLTIENPEVLKGLSQSLTEFFTKMIMRIIYKITGKEYTAEDDKLAKDAATQAVDEEYQNMKPVPVSITIQKVEGQEDVFNIIFPPNSEGKETIVKNVRVKDGKLDFKVSGPEGQSSWSLKVDIIDNVCVLDGTATAKTGLFSKPLKTKIYLKRK